MSLNRKFHIQFQPNLVQGLDLTEFEKKLDAEKIDYTISKGNDDGVYVNYDFITDNIHVSWSFIESLLIKNQNLRNSSIVCCQGSNGWDNYLLLSHYDQSEKLDAIKNH